MVRLRAGSIGSIRAWLPSRRSVDSHRGAVVICLVGQVRAAIRVEMSVGIASWEETYLETGMPWGVRFGIGGPSSCGRLRPGTTTPRRGSGLLGLVAAAKEEVDARAHGGHRTTAPGAPARAAAVLARG